MTKVGQPPSSASDAPALGARLGRLRIQHLQLLDSIGRHGSLSAAAAALGVSQPRATNMLRDVEDAFGCRLFDRSSRGGRLNAAGLSALERLRIALGALDAAQATLHGAAGRPLVRIGVLPLVGSDRLSRVVADLQADDALPRLVLRVGTVGELLALLVAGEVDAVISGIDAEAAALLPRLRMVRLWDERLVIVAARDNPILRRREVALGELLRHPWLLMPPRSANRQAFNRLFLRAGLPPPDAAVETESPHMGLAFVARGRMLAVVPESAYLQATDRVGRVRVDGGFEAAAVNMITLRDVPALAFVDQLAPRLEALAQAAARPGDAATRRR